MNFANLTSTEWTAVVIPAGSCGLRLISNNNFFVSAKSDGTGAIQCITMALSYDAETTIYVKSMQDSETLIIAPKMIFSK